MPVVKQRTATSGKAVVALLAVIAAVVLIVLTYLNRQYVIDQIAFWQYQPSSQVAAIAMRTTMSDTGRFYFYSNSPSVEDAIIFNQSCAKEEKATAILGCYTNHHIFVYNVANAQLDGIKEVTAAHEMLHAVFERLSDDEKKRVSALIEVEYGKLRQDKKFAERMAFYERTEPGERDNELHSIIGTEVSSISAELELYYGRYFTDRAKVVSLHGSYAEVFDRLESRSQELSDELIRLADKINAETATYNEAIKQLNADISSFNSRASSGGFSSQSAFQAERSTLVVRSNELDSTRTSINTDVARYNQLRDELTSIASQSEALNKSIDSTLAPAPSV